MTRWLDSFNKAVAAWPSTLIKTVLMKTKFFAILVLFSVAPVATYAQTGYPTRSVSIQVGLGLSSVTTPDAIKDLPDPHLDLIDIGYRSGFNIRASVYLPILGGLGTQLGLGWIQKGWSSEVEPPEFTGEDDDDLFDYYNEASFEYRVRVNYVSAPTLLQFNPISTVHLLAGPVFSFALSCSAEATAEINGTVTERVSGDCDDDDISMDLNTVDLSIMVGAGVNIPITSAFSVSLEAVYDLGITDFSPEDGNKGSKNKSFGITAGVSLPLGR